MVITDWNMCPHCLRVHPGTICRNTLLAEAEAAIKRQAARKDENIDEWADRLAHDLSKFTD